MPKNIIDGQSRWMRSILSAQKISQRGLKMDFNKNGLIVV